MNAIIIGNSAFAMNIIQSHSPECHIVKRFYGDCVINDFDSSWTIFWDGQTDWDEDPWGRDLIEIYSKAISAGIKFHDREAFMRMRSLAKLCMDHMIQLRYLDSGQGLAFSSAT